MGRPEKPIDPESGPLASFAADLRILRGKAGITYRGMAKSVHYSVTSLAAAAAGDELPTLAVTLAYVEACGGNRAEWEPRWRALAAELRDSPARPASGMVGAPGTPGPRRRRLIAACGALIVLAAALAITLWATATTPHPAVSRVLGGDGKAGRTGKAGRAQVAGLGCPPTLAHTFSDYNMPGSDGWHHVGGGWSGNGCSGLAEFTHITGFPQVWQQTADWVFGLQAARRCSLAIYIPGNAEADGVAQYDLYNSTNTNYDSRLTTITINQAAHHGQWVPAGTFRFTHPVIDLEITDRGTGHATIALSAVKLTCA